MNLRIHITLPGYYKPINILFKKLPNLLVYK